MDGGGHREAGHIQVASGDDRTSAHHLCTVHAWKICDSKDSHKSDSVFDLKPSLQQLNAAPSPEHDKFAMLRRDQGNLRINCWKSIHEERCVNLNVTYSLNNMLKPNFVDGDATVNGKKNSRCGLDNL